MIRFATPEDTSALVEMLCGFHAEAGKQHVDFCEKSAGRTIEHIAALDDETIKGVVFVAVDDESNAPIGVLAALRLPVFVNFGVLAVQEVVWWVKPEYRNKGVGGHMLNCLECWARSEGAEIITMISWHGSMHESMSRFYEGAGYVPMEYHYLKRLGAV